MYEKREVLHIATLFANVPDLDAVLSELYTRLGLRPFLRFELEEADYTVPIALVRIGGEHTLELLGRVEGDRPASGLIQMVEIEMPVRERIDLEPAPGMKIVCHPGTNPRIRSFEVSTTMPKEDTAAFIDHLGAIKDNPENPLDLGDVQVQLTSVEGLPVEENPGLFFPGWHRLSVHVPSVLEAYDTMTASGSSLHSLVEPFQVIPGLKEAMLLFPSGLICQITEESLLKMTPSLAIEWVRSKFSGHAMHFKSKEVY